MATMEELLQQQELLKQQMDLLKKQMKMSKNWRNDPELKQIAEQIETFALQHKVGVNYVKVAVAKLLPKAQRAVTTKRVKIDAGPTRAQLTKMAKERGVKFERTATKEDLITLLKL